MSFKVVITMNNRPPSEITLNVIRDAGLEVEYVKCATENEVITAAQGADVLLGGTQHRPVVGRCNKVLGARSSSVFPIYGTTAHLPE